MIDLKNEIEKLKDKFIEYASSLTTGRVDALDKVLDIIEDYNIITAPKTIKLSELIDKIYETKFKSECWVDSIRSDKSNCRILIQCDDDCQGFCVYEFYIEDKKIVMHQDYFLLPFDEFKWLYALWIAGTIIEDDLKEE